MTKQKSIDIVAVKQAVRDGKLSFTMLQSGAVLLKDEISEEAVLIPIQAEAEKSETLRTTWETPESCPYCMEHLARDWAFCPTCGRPTDWSEEEPLTVEEVRALPLREWLWVEVLQEGYYREAKSAYYRVQADYSRGEALCCGYPGLGFEFEYEDYGKTWLPYRRKPKEEDNNA